MNEMFLLRNDNAGYLGNSPLFWASSGGYTQWIDEAKQFTEQEADETIGSCRGTHRFHKIPWAMLDRIAKRTVDVQDFYKDSKNE